ncbi:MAG TPA: Na+/H+ antiporter subunit E [Thermomicrobiales bacterium]|nr:Na+/H+ antiporter subunit E [Thermomicrobiales bacterium]
MIFLIVVTLGLTLVYALVLASFAVQDLLLGAMLAAGLVWIYRKTLFPRTLPDGPYVLHILVFMPKFLAMLIWDILKGTWQVTTFVVGFRKLDHPGIVKIPLGNHSRAGTGIVGLFVTLSPGSFLVDIDWEERMMLVHVIDASNPDTTREDAEKYYRLWEYGTHIPQGPDDPTAHTGAG